MNGYQEVEQAMQHMCLIASHERPEAFIGKAISIYIKESQTLLCSAVLSFELKLMPRKEPPAGERPFPRDLEIIVRTSLLELITVSRTRYSGHNTAVVWRYGETPVIFEEDVTIR